MVVSTSGNLFACGLVSLCQSGDDEHGKFRLWVIDY